MTTLRTGVNGIGETLTLLVPNVKGGASSDNLSQSETAMEKANPMYSSIYSQFPQYFGDQPWTAGPVYVGAFDYVPVRPWVFHRKRSA